MRLVSPLLLPLRVHFPRLVGGRIGCASVAVVDGG